MTALRKYGLVCVAAILGFALASCSPGEMDEQSRYEYLEKNDAFADGRSARPIPKGTVPRDTPLPSASFRSGRDTAGVFLSELPVELSEDLLLRGQERFNIYCSVCHGNDGYGSGIIVRRGFPAPPSFHSERLRQAPIGYFTHVIENGFGIMYPYASRVDPEDRWAIAAYIRALQLTQHAEAASLPEQERQRLEVAAP